MYDLSIAQAALKTCISWSDFLIPKTFFIFALFTNRKKIMQWYKSRTPKRNDLVHGVPKDELVDFLFRNNGLPSSAVKSLKMPQREYQKLGKALDKCNVTYKDKENNNYRTLNEEMPRAEVARVLEQYINDGYTTKWWSHKNPSLSEMKEEG